MFLPSQEIRRKKRLKKIQDEKTINKKKTINQKIKEKILEKKKNGDKKTFIDKFVFNFKPRPRPPRSISVKN